MSNTNFNSLGDKVDELIQLCSDMKVENQILRDHEHHWQNERDSLMGKNQMARVRLENVLKRLKTLQQG